MSDNVHEDPRILGICREVRDSTYPKPMRGDAIVVKLPKIRETQREIDNEEDTLP